MLKTLQNSNTNKAINFYNKHLLNIYTGIDIALEKFCTMTEQMKINF